MIALTRLTHSRGSSVQAELPRRRLPERLVRFIAVHATLAVVLVSVAAFLWPPTLGSTGVSLVLLFGLGEAHPFQLRQRADAVVLSEFVVALAALALPAAEVPWVAVGGALMAPPMLRWVGTHERLRVANIERHVLNFAKNAIGLAPMVALTTIARPAGLLTLWLATSAGLAVYAVLSEAIVRGAITRSRGSGSTLTTRQLGEDLRVAGALALASLPVGLVLRTEAPTWPVVLVVGVAFVLIARARMGRDTVTYRLSAVTQAIEELAATRSVADLDDRLRRIIARALVAHNVEVLDEEPPRTPRVRDHLVGRVGDSGPWIRVSQPGLDAPWTSLDRALLQALLSAAAPIRQRLQDLARVEEAERFASLVLTAAGHDVANRLHAARLATQTLLEQGATLPPEMHTLILQRADAALHRGAGALTDMVALGAGGRDARCTGAEVALFARELGADLRVLADNVVMTAPGSVVERIVENLVTNAARHHAGREPVEVAVDDLGGEVCIVVRDRGPGLDADDVELLFRPFAQLADGPRRRGSLGLGLFIARGLAESVGGSLGYADRAGGGAQFEVRIPSASEDVGQGRQERVVLGPGSDRHAQAPVEPRLRREVANEDALRQ